MLVKKHISGGKLILAICDSELIGKKFTEGEFILDLGSSFYKGEKKEKEEVLRLIKAAYIINAAGKKSVSLLVEEGIIPMANVSNISGILHAQVLFDEKI